MSAYQPGEPLAICEFDGATLWPREHYPSADAALAAGAAVDGWVDVELGPDLEPWPPVRVRLVWAVPVPDHPEGEWWEWTPAPRANALEAWEVVHP